MVNPVEEILENVEKCWFAPIPNDVSVALNNYMNAHDTCRIIYMVDDLGEGSYLKKDAIANAQQNERDTFIALYKAIFGPNFDWYKVYE